MSPTNNYRPLAGSQHPHPKEYKKLHPTDPAEQLTVTLILRRKPGHTRLTPRTVIIDKKTRPTHDAFAAAHGAEPHELDAVVAFAKTAGLDVLQTDAARRSVVVRGSAAAINKAFDVQLNNYQ